MQMNHRININNHCELKKAEAFKYLENILIVLQKKKFLTILAWAFLYMCTYNGRNPSRGTFLVLNCFKIHASSIAVVESKANSVLFVPLPQFMHVDTAGF